MPNYQDLYRTATTGAGTSADAADAQAGAARNHYLDLINGGQGAVANTAQAAWQALLPQYQQQVQGLRANAVRRGISNSETQGLYEGDALLGAQRNVANAIAGQSMNLYGQQLNATGDVYNTESSRAESGRNRYLGMLGDETSMERYDQEQKKKRKSGLWGTLGTIAGAAIGGLAGGSQGAAVGASVGGSLGGGGW